MYTKETRTQIKQIKDELKTLGFKISTHPAYKGACVYNEKKTFCLIICFYDNKYCSAQMTIDVPEYLDSFFNYDAELLLHLNFELDKLNKVVPTAKKAMKIIDSLNKKFEQVNTDIKKFEKLV